MLNLRKRILKSLGVAHTVKWGCNIKITSRYKDGSVEVDEFHNSIHNAALNAMRDLLDGDVTDLQIKYFAWGNDNSAVDATDTDLGNELGRKAITSQTAGGTGVMTTVTIIQSTEAVAQLEEFGWFAGADAGAGAGTGIMISRVLYSRNKTGLESIQVERTDTFAEG